MDECEFKAICIYDEDLEEKKANCSWEPDSVNDCPHHKYFKLQHDLILNSPQFKKQYAKLSVVKKEIEKFRQSLLKEYEKMTGVLNVEFHASLDEAYQKYGPEAMFSYVVARSHKLIRTHRKETE